MRIRRFSFFYYANVFVRLAGFEPATSRSEVECSSPLSYRRMPIILPDKLKKSLILGTMGYMKVVPREVREVISKLEKRGFKAYVVGGCVRDLLIGVEPKDWDVATSAEPEQIQKLFPDSFYENKFFTVTIRTKSKETALKEIETTTFRSDLQYRDHRHPKKVRVAKTIEQDLARRDFTMNAIALLLKTRGYEFIDPFKGKQDIEDKILRAVGKPQERFKEDALRMMRAVRLAATLGFDIESSTKNAIQDASSLLKKISKERIRDEFVKIIMADNAVKGVELLRELRLLQYIVPELEEGYGVSQNKHHIYTVWEHNILALAYAVKQKWSCEVRIASLFHDVAKPRVKKGDGYNSTFYNHETVGGRMTREILSRMKFSKKEIERISKLVRYHLFYYNVDEVSESSVRRLVRNVGLENMEDLLKVRMADRIGSGVPKAEPYKLRHLKYLIEKVSKDPISVSMLKVRGDEIMKLLNILPGPKVGQINDILLNEIIEDPKKNIKQYLEKRIKALGKLKDKKVLNLAQKSRKDREQFDTKTDTMMKKKYWVT